MSDDMIELGKRARASKHFRWMPGMRATEAAGGYDQHLCEADFGATPPYAGELEAVPDLADPATLGCLLALVREAYSDPGVGIWCVQYVGMPRIWRASTHMRDRPCPDHSGFTEAEALVRALEAAP